MYKLPIEKSYNKYSTQIDIPKKLSDRIKTFKKGFIDKDNIVEDENEVHITVLYGIDFLRDKKEIKDILGSATINGSLGKINKFSSKKHDVIHIEIDSILLDSIHEILKEQIDNSYSFKKYNPHLTLAYVKKGSCNDLIGKDYFVGEKFKNLPVKFCYKSGKKEEISGGK